MRTNALLGFLAPFFVAAASTTGGVVTVVRYDPTYEVLGMIAVLTSVTALTFILILLSCGLKKPVI